MTVYLRAESVAMRATRDALELRAETLAGMVEVADDGIDFEAPLDLMPEYLEPRSGYYFIAFASDAYPYTAAESLGEETLPDPGPWTPTRPRYEEIESGPYGAPCAVYTHSFLARVEGYDDDDDPPDSPPVELRRFQMQVAIDTTARDADLAGLATFLGVSGGALLVLTLGAGLLLSRRLLAPVRKMTREAAAMTPDDAGRRLDPGEVVRELDSLAKTLNSAFDRLANALVLQRRFTSDASHELRTPLSVLLGNAEFLLRRPRTVEDYREGLERQLRIARRMKHITENLLTLARADSASDGAERVRVEMDGLVRSLCEEFRGTAEERKVEFTCRCESDLRVRGDRSQIAQLVSNLLSNALKFTEAGGRIEVDLGTSDGRVRLTVSDTGRGIPREHLPHIFDRFYRVSEGRDQEEGAGLGLSIVKWIARSHGGSVTVESDPGEGTRFTVEFPKSSDG